MGAAARSAPPPRQGQGLRPQRASPSALRQAGVVLKHDPVGVVVDPDRYETDIRPPILQRREKYWKPNSRAGEAPIRDRVQIARPGKYPRVW